VELHFRSIDVLFESVAASFGRNTVAVILTGGDGVAGIQAAKRAGGITIAQDEASSESFSMPRTAIETGAVDYILPLEAIAPILMPLIHR
jgi:two-component system chemotaxis response regulator CheB